MVPQLVVGQAPLRAGREPGAGEGVDRALELRPHGVGVVVGPRLGVQADDEALVRRTRLDHPLERDDVRVRDDDGLAAPAPRDLVRGAGRQREDGGSAAGTRTSRACSYGAWSTRCGQTRSWTVRTSGTPSVRSARSGRAARRRCGARRRSGRAAGRPRRRARTTRTARAAARATTGRRARRARRVGQADDVHVPAHGGEVADVRVVARQGRDAQRDRDGHLLETARAPLPGGGARHASVTRDVSRARRRAQVGREQG